MNTEMTLEIDSSSLENTFRLAEIIGRNLKGSEVIELISDLGGGKTAFTRGLAIGVDSKDEVTSPSFTITNVYSGKSLKIYHFDFYRLTEPGIMANEMSEMLEDPAGVVVVEWGDVVRALFPGKTIRLYITQTGEDTRHFKFLLPKAYSYVLKGVI